MSYYYKSIQLSILIFCFASSLFAQFSGSNLGEFQYGRLPNDSTSVATVYDRIVTSYSFGSFKTRVVFEGFETGIPESDYLALSQFSIRFKKRPFELEIGNFYETIGRGVLLRSFEVPGAILEDHSFRSRHYFHRDMLGVNARYRQSKIDMKFIYGKPLNYVFPPTIEKESRRPDEIAAFYIDYNLGKQTLGAAMMTHVNGIHRDNYSMINTNGSLFGKLSYYTEIAKNISDHELDDFSRNTSYGIYSNLNFFTNRLGISFEYKNYNRFVIGAGINEPPAGIKEHTYSVLNRSTHVLQPDNETGYQFELFYNFLNNSILTLNTSLAQNKQANTEFIFEEYFAEYDFIMFDSIDMKCFVDFAEDLFKLEQQRVSIGFNAIWAMLTNSSAEIGYQNQRFDRLNQRVQNHVLALDFHYAPKWSTNILYEYSNDPFLTERTSARWLGVGLRHKLNRKNSLQVFAGNRRGGPACQAGVCYEVLDFSGVEIRFTSRF